MGTKHHSSSDLVSDNKKRRRAASSKIGTSLASDCNLPSHFFGSWTCGFRLLTALFSSILCADAGIEANECIKIYLGAFIACYWIYQSSFFHLAAFSVFSPSCCSFWADDYCVVSVRVAFGGIVDLLTFSDY